MPSDSSPQISREEARSSLEEIDRIGSQIRRAIASGRAAPMLILWGSIWVVGFTAGQFVPRYYRVWIVLDIVGIAVTCLSSWRGHQAVRSPQTWRIGVAWLILFIYAAFWCSLIAPWEMSHAPGWAIYGPLMERKMSMLWVTVCMFAYVMMGLWLDRFFLWLGALVTVAALIGYFFMGNYFSLWIALTGGGALIVAGLFIRKYWR